MAAAIANYDDMSEWTQEGPIRVPWPTKPFSGDLKTVVYKKTGALLAFRCRDRNRTAPTERMLYASGKTANAKSALDMGAKFMRGELRLPEVDGKPSTEDTEAKDLASARLSRKFPGEKRGHDPPARSSSRPGASKAARPYPAASSSSSYYAGWSQGAWQHGATTLC